MIKIEDISEAARAAADTRNFPGAAGDNGLLRTQFILAAILVNCTQEQLAAILSTLKDWK